MPYFINVDNFYGTTGSGKTWSLARAAQYYAEKHQKPFRIVASDTGGSEHIQSFVTAGIVQLWNLTKQRKHLIEDMVKLSQGWWPEDVDDPMAKLIPPGPGNDLKSISGLGFDSATSMCEMQMEFYVGDVTLAQGAQELNFGGVRPPQVPKGAYVHDGEFLMRFSGPSDFGGIQNSIVKMITDSAALGLPKTIWTARETKGAEQIAPGKDAKGNNITIKREEVYGPDFIGYALTAKSGGWFGNQLHFDFVKVETTEEIDVGGAKTKVKLDRRMPAIFTVRHGDPTGADPLNIPHLAKTRVDARLAKRVPAVMQADAYEFYKLLDQLTEEAKKLPTGLLNKERA